MTRPREFTAERLDWLPWIETVADIGLSDEQLETVYMQAPNAKGSPSFRDVGARSARPRAADRVVQQHHAEPGRWLERRSGIGGHGDVSSQRLHLIAPLCMRNGTCNMPAALMSSLHFSPMERKLGWMTPARKQSLIFHYASQMTRPISPHDDLQDMRDAGFSELEVFSEHRPGGGDVRLGQSPDVDVRGAGAA